MLRRAAKFRLHPRGTASCWQLSHNTIPTHRTLVPTGHKWSQIQRQSVEQTFPVINIKLAFNRCRVGALPVEDGYVVEASEKTNEYEIAQARRQAKGTVKLILEAIEAAQPELLAEGKRVKLASRPVKPELLVSNLNDLWKPLNKKMTDSIVLGVMKAVKNCSAGMHFFHWAAEHTDFEASTATYNGLVEMLLKRGFTDQALQIFRIMLRPSFASAGCGPDGETIAILVRELCVKEFEKALAVVNYALFESQGMEVADDVIHEVIKSLCRMAGQLPLSLRYFHRMKNPSDETYQLLVRTMSKEQFLYEAYDLIVSMEMGKGFPTDDVTYHLLISEFCRRKELSRAHVLLYDFMDRGRTPSVITFNTVLQLLCSRGDRDAAEKAWKLWLCLKSRSVKPTAVTFSIVLQVLANANRVDQTMILLDEMLRNGCVPGTITGSAVISALARADRVHEALDLVIRMHDEFKHAVEAEATTNTIYGFLRLKPLKDSVKALKKMEKVNFVPDLELYNVVIAMLCKKKMLKQAMLYFNEAAAKRTLNVSSYEPLVMGFCAAGKLVMAYKLFQDMIQRGCEPNLGIYKTIISCFCSSGSMDDACKLLEYMFNKDVYPDGELYSAVIEGLERTGNAQACDILRNAVNQTAEEAPINEVMFKAIYRLRSCVRPVAKDGGGKGIGSSKMDASETEAAELVEGLPATPLQVKVCVPERFSESDTEESGEEGDDEGETEAADKQQISFNVTRQDD